jgi:hypothetical protein
MLTIGAYTISSKRVCRPTEAFDERVVSRAPAMVNKSFRRSGGRRVQVVS